MESMNNQKDKAITGDMLIMDILLQHPEVAPILMGYGLHCVGCHFSSYDTLSSGARIHGMDDETVEMMLKDANTIIEKFAKAEAASKEEKFD